MDPDFPRFIAHGQIAAIGREGHRGDGIRILILLFDHVLPDTLVEPPPR